MSALEHLDTLIADYRRQIGTFDATPALQPVSVCVIDAKRLFLRQLESLREEFEHAPEQSAMPAPSLRVVGQTPPMEAAGKASH